MKKFQLTQKTTDILDEMEYLQSIVDQANNKGNYNSYEEFTREGDAILRGLGINREIARDLGWKL